MECFNKTQQHKFNEHLGADAEWRQIITGACGMNLFKSTLRGVNNPGGWAESAKIVAFAHQT